MARQQTSRLARQGVFPGGGVEKMILYNVCSPADFIALPPLAKRGSGWADQNLGPQPFPVPSSFVVRASPPLDKGGPGGAVEKAILRGATFPPVLFPGAARPLTPNPSPRRGEGDRKYASRGLKSPSPQRGEGARRAGEGVGVYAQQNHRTLQHPLSRGGRG